MTYQEVTEAIQGKRRFGTCPGVGIAARMLSMLGSPQQGMKLIHIAGTNGKGSVSAFLCGILKAAGVRTGMFTSPHLTEFEERIRVDGRMIGREAVRRIGEELLVTEFGVSPTMFDYSLAMALLYFKEMQCEAVILETGLGGRLDSTNAVGMPLVTVITKIGYDHMEVLGTTLAGIAAEKAGIIKPDTALVTESQPSEALCVILAAAAEAGVACTHVIDPDDIRDCRLENGRQVFSYGAYKDLTMRMLGTHQYENAVAALLAAELFFARRNVSDLCGSAAGQAAVQEPSPVSGAAPDGPCVTVPSRVVARAAGQPTVVAAAAGQQPAGSGSAGVFIRQGIRDAVWPGRMELLREEPFLMADGAHNSCGVAALRDSLAALFPGETFHFLMGVMADKDYEEMVDLLLPLAHDFTTVTVESARALQAATLAALIRGKGIPASDIRDLRAFLFTEQKNDKHKTIAFGSLYFIGELRGLTKREDG